MGESLNFLVVGAGLSGATLARTLAENGARVTIFEQESHCAGHCHTERDPQTGIMVHVHGPHIFHSDNADVWTFCERFAEFVPYRHEAFARIGERFFRLPINLDTINAWFGTEFDSAEAEAFVKRQCIHFDHAPRNFEEQALATVGPDLYEAFLKGYTEKQWGREPAQIPASVLRRLPLRFNTNSSYFHHRRVAIPRDGYTAMVERMLDHPAIEVRYGTHHRSSDDVAGYEHVFFTGPLDAWFHFCLGRLPYRSLRFETLRSEGDFQPAACVNYPDPDTPFTRITEHKKLASWEKHAVTVCSKEFSFEAGPGDRPYYPVHVAGGSQMLERYRERALAESGVSFVGRLATFRYIDMDVAIDRALSAAEQTLDCVRQGRAIPVFFDTD